MELAVHHTISRTKGLALQAFSRGNRVVVLLCTLAMIAVVVALLSIAGGSESAAMRTGDRIVSALRQYHQYYDCYPDQLGALIPEFLGSVPQPRWGTGRWSYSTGGECDSFWLSVGWDSHDYPLIYYKCDEGYWSMDE